MCRVCVCVCVFHSDWVKRSRSSHSQLQCYLMRMSCHAISNAFAIYALHRTTLPFDVRVSLSNHYHHYSVLLTVSYRQPKTANLGLEMRYISQYLSTIDLHAPTSCKHLHIEGRCQYHISAVYLSIINIVRNRVFHKLRRNWQ